MTTIALLWLLRQLRRWRDSRALAVPMTGERRRMLNTAQWKASEWSR